MPTKDQLVKLYQKVHDDLPLGSDNKKYDPNANVLLISIVTMLIDAIHDLLAVVKKHEPDNLSAISVKKDDLNTISLLHGIVQATFAKFFKAGQCVEYSTVCISEFLLDAKLEGSAEVVFEYKSKELKATNAHLKHGFALFDKTTEDVDDPSKWNVGTKLADIWGTPEPREVTATSPILKSDLATIALLDPKQEITLLTYFRISKPLADELKNAIVKYLERIQEMCLMGYFDGCFKGKQSEMRPQLLKHIQSEIDLYKRAFGLVKVATCEVKSDLPVAPGDLSNNKATLMHNNGTSESTASLNVTLAKQGP